MQKSFNSIFCAICLNAALLFGQIPGLKQDFNDGAIDGWKADHPRTFQLSAADSALKISYTRTDTSEMWDNFNYTPPELIDPTGDPRITLRVKSNVKTQLTFKPVYSDNSSDWLQKNLTNDNQWHDVQFNLINYSGLLIKKIYLYLDGGSTTPSSGIVYFDDLIIGSENYVIKITDAWATVIDSSRIDLGWTSNYPSLVKYYNIYRSGQSGFECSAATFLDSTASTALSDSGLAPYTNYYYKITAVDADSAESSPSSQLKAYTAGSKSALAIGVEAINSESIGLYDNFEIIVDLREATFENPYDPEEINVGATFTSPSGKTWKLFGFYDNFENRDQWKVRFSPNESGTWFYQLKATDITGTAASDTFSFEAIPSDYHGWIKPSTKNPHYFEHDDGASFYGVGAYYPWQVTEDGLTLLENSGANLWGYWNSFYDDGAIIESMNSGIGKYDQKKCGRIDQLLDWSAARGMKMMLAIWPHDVISATVWGHFWDKNPYNQITEAKDFFDNEEAWSYQQKQYRYLIARWGCYRSLGIWEIVNEINGTDAWQSGRKAQGLAWVKKVDDFLKENDPFEHPTTASQSGGIYWKDGYKEVDVPNVHLYEKGWFNFYPHNPLRGSIYTYHSMSAKLWKDFAKPAFMGEAGYRNTYGNWDTPSPEYTTMYHNALWTTWANGNASTPMWWEFHSRDVMSDDVLAQLKAFSAIAQQIDYVDNTVHPIEAKADGCDAYALAGDSLIYGWVRQSDGANISNKEIILSSVPDTTFAIGFINTRQGTIYKLKAGLALDSTLIIQTPALADSSADVAFIIRAASEDFTDVQKGPKRSVVDNFVLGQNYPNPFNPITTIEYIVPRQVNVRLQIFDPLGRLVATLVSKEQDAGRHKIQFDGSNLASGMYIVTLSAGESTLARKILLLK